MWQKLMNRKIWIVLGIASLIVATGCGKRATGVINCEGIIGQFDVSIKSTGSTQAYVISITPRDLDFNPDTVGITLFNNSGQYQSLANWVQVYEGQPLSYQATQQTLSYYNILVIHPASNNVGGDTNTGDDAVCTLPVTR